MRQKIDIHEWQRRYDRTLRRLKIDKEISESNLKKILAFIGDLQAEGITVARQAKYLYLLPKLAKLLQKDFDKATVEDIKQVASKINGSKMAEWTKSDCRIALKRFYRWLKKLPKGQDPPETVWMKIGGSNHRVLPEELLSEEDIAKLVNASENSRDRAFLLCIYETGGRIGELLNLRRKHVQFDQYGAVLIFSGKTGDRRVRIIASAPALSQWMNDHPSQDPEFPLWTIIGDKHHGKPLLYFPARVLLKRLAKRARIRKRVNPHAFRHARASFLANAMTERQMEQYLGWTPGSDMPRVYVHLSGRDTDDVLLRMHGFEKEEFKKPKLSVVVCPRCQQNNDPMVRFCAKCGLPLKIEAAIEIEQQRTQADDIMNRLLDDPEFRTYLLSKLKSLGLNQSATQISAVQP